MHLRVEGADALALADKRLALIVGGEEGGEAVWCGGGDAGVAVSVSNVVVLHQLALGAAKDQAAVGCHQVLGHRVRREVVCEGAGAEEDGVVQDPEVELGRDHAQQLLLLGGIVVVDRSHLGVFVFGGYWGE